MLKRFVRPLLATPRQARRDGAILALVLAAGLVVFAGEAVRAAETSLPSKLVQQLDRILSKPPLKRASVGIYVERLSDGQALYARGADTLLIPASNQKILTALATLERFGPTHRFSTRIWAPARPDAEGAVRELVVEGGGDPAMNSEDWWRLAADLRREGLRAVEGNIRVDDTLFDGPGWHPSWGAVSARAYHAPVGALTANYATFFVSIWPQATVGSSVLVDIDPPVHYLRVRNLAKTGASNAARPRLSVGRVAGRTTGGPAEEIIRVEGMARRGDDVDRFPRSVLDPGLYAGSVLAYQLEANGIGFDGEVLRQPLGAENEKMVLLLEHTGRTVSEAVALCMKYSNNSIAEILVKNLDTWSETNAAGLPTHQGGWAGGIRALRDQIGRLGVDLTEATLVDGSGLSIQNRVSPRMLVGALRAGRESFQIGPEFVAALPIAELDGTLEKRIEGSSGQIRAKTGLLSDASVTALSGFAEGDDGETLVFSILVNGHSGGSAGAMDAVDAIARTLLDESLRVPKPMVGQGG